MTKHVSCPHVPARRPFIHVELGPKPPAKVTVSKQGFGFDQLATDGDDVLHRRLLVSADRIGNAPKAYGRGVFQNRVIEGD